MKTNSEHQKRGKSFDVIVSHKIIIANETQYSQIPISASGINLKSDARLRDGYEVSFQQMVLGNKTGLEVG